MSNVDRAEIKHFEQLAHEFWDPHGSYSLLILMNPTRVHYIVQHLKSQGVDSLEGVSVLDVGCGGGLLSESLAELGAQVTGIDATSANIVVAKEHKAQSARLSSYPHLTYHDVYAEELVERGEQFDVVCALEVIEHVADAKAFVATIAALVKPNGFLYLSTQPRNLLSGFAGIFMVEYVLGWVPKGTHHYSKFVNPDQVAKWFAESGCSVKDLQGTIYLPVWQKWWQPSWKAWWTRSLHYTMALQRK